VFRGVSPKLYRTRLIMRANIFEVDFNELVEPDLVLFSKEDRRPDIDGLTIMLSEGMKVSLISDDLDDDGQPDYLVADGTIVRNTSEGWSSHVKWACRIDERGIRHGSDERRDNQEVR
jgi:hypothetical protein